MSYKLSWLLENRIILITYDGVFTKADLETYLKESLDMRDRANAVLGAGGPLVHTVTDARRMTKQDLSLQEALKVVETLRKQRVGWSIYIAANKLDQFLAGVGHQFAGVRYRSVSTVQEGIDFLKKVDDTLADFTYSKDDSRKSIRE
ncbi:MAG: hypothetical protein IAE80_20420 [Anaerolinea sp.]|mgnify:CR=1 FL=1|nr:hypothetical protein [Anaerolinea sp.]